MKPSGKLAFTFEGMAVPPYLEKHLWNQLLGILLIAQHPIGDVENPSVVFVVELAQSRLVPCTATR
jgi:hypothetical protein